jgi:hypothetical protein
MGVCLHLLMLLMHVMLPPSCCSVAVRYATPSACQVLLLPAAAAAASVAVPVSSQSLQ